MMQAASKVADSMLGKNDVAMNSTRPRESETETMRAVVYLGKQKTGVETKPKPLLTHPNDVIIQVTSCTICSGSDSHLYSGEIPAMRNHSIMGHEGMGVIESKGENVKNFEIGDRAVIAFNIACGFCGACKREEFSGCENTNDSKLTQATYGHCPCGIFGYSDSLGGVPGSQAEYVRVPFADVNCYKIPDSIPDEKALYMSDVLCTSLHSVVQTEVKEGSTVAIWGLGPIGLCAARWCQIKGAKTIIGIDLVQQRLQLAKEHLGITVIDRREVSKVAEKVVEICPGGVDAAIDAVGFRYPTTLTHKFQRAVGLETDSPDIITECFMGVRKWGVVSLIGDYVGKANNFPIGMIMMKHLTVRSGQCPCQRYFEYVLDHLKNGKFDPTFMITQRITFDEAPEAYAKLFEDSEGWIKVFMTPNKK